MTISFEAIENARDLGGLRTRDGRTVRSGRLLRCGNLSRATDSDLERLQRDFQLSDIVDFRFDAEAAKDPDREIPGARRTQLSTLPQVMIDGFSSSRSNTGQLSAQEFAAALVHHAMNPDAQALSRGMYPAIVMDGRAQRYYGDFLRVVLNAEGGVLWHCSQGKDRAGLAAAFLLAALGADRQTILSDFVLSSEYYTPQIAMLSAQVREMGGDQAALDFIQAMVGVSRTNFERALDLIDAQYGSLEAYIGNQLGFSPAEQEQLREKYLI